MFNPFPVRIRALSIIDRWSIIWTIQRDTVAQHLFYSAVYSMIIADLIEWQGDRNVLHTIALLHDMEEQITGDIVGVVKNHIVDAKKSSDFVSRVMSRQMPTIHAMFQTAQESDPDKEAYRIVKAADHMDAAFYALTEQALGNKIIGSRVLSTVSRLKASWYKLPAERGHLEKTWKSVIQALDEHNYPNNYDIWTD